MNGILVLDRIRVQGANAVAGLTWGFPAPSAFAGFCHALDRRLRPDRSRSPALFGGCAIVCHDHQALTVSHYGTHQFSLARVPLTRQGKTAPFNEEGRMHMTVSLMIEVGDGLGDFLATIPDDADEQVSASKWFADRAGDAVMSMRLAGGTVLDLAEARYLPQAGEGGDPEADRKLLFSCLPGFVLVDRSELLARHLESSRSRDPDATVLQAWMDFASLRFRSEEPKGDAAEWTRVPPLPETGWFVPLMIGYQAIAPLSAPGTVHGTRDPTLPFRLVESVYGIGQWISPHRIKRVQDLMWRHEYEDQGRYMLVNRFDNTLHRQEQPA